MKTPTYSNVASLSPPSEGLGGLTKRFFILFILCIILALAGMQWSLCLILAKVGIAALACVTVAEAAVFLFVSQRLKVERTHSTYFSLGQHNEVTLTVSLLLPDFLKDRITVETFDDVPPSFSTNVGENGFSGLGTFTYSAVPCRRGRFKIDLTRSFLRFRHPGFVEVRRFLAKGEEIKVYPSFKNLDKLEIQASSMEQKAGPKRMRRKGNSTAFDQIRPYIAGDDVRTINWRASARSTTLMVNTYTDERSQPIIPILCAGPSMQNATEGVTLLDRAASAAIALAASAVRHYDEAGLLTVSQLGVEAYVAPERSTKTVAKMLEQTFRFGLDPSEEEQLFLEDPDVTPDEMTEEEAQQIRESILVYDAEPNFDAMAAYVNRWISRRSLLVLFANFENIEMARNTLPALLRISRKHALIVVLFENEGVKAVARGHKSNIGSSKSNAAGAKNDAADAKSDTAGRKTTHKLYEMRFRTLCNDYLEQQFLLADYLQKQGINVILTSPQNLTTAVLQKYLEMKSRAAI